MTPEELKSKIVNLAQAYRNERLRGEEMQKALKAQNAEVSMAQKITAEFE
jgi:hypothetical protein